MEPKDFWEAIKVSDLLPWYIIDFYTNRSVLLLFVILAFLFWGGLFLSFLRRALSGRKEEYDSLGCILGCIIKYVFPISITSALFGCFAPLLISMRPNILLWLAGIRGASLYQLSPEGIQLIVSCLRLIFKLSLTAWLSLLIGLIGLIGAVIREWREMEKRIKVLEEWKKGFEEWTEERFKKLSSHG